MQRLYYFFNAMFPPLNSYMSGFSPSWHVKWTMAKLTGVRRPQGWLLWNLLTFFPSELTRERILTSGLQPIAILLIFCGVPSLHFP